MLAAFTNFSVKFPSLFRCFPCLAVLSCLGFVGNLPASDFNSLVLAQIHSMPVGGRYAANRDASSRLAQAVRLEGDRFSVVSNGAVPSYCSGATYLVFLKTIEAISGQGKLVIEPNAYGALLIHGQTDGAGVWGRWNANGPGTARFFKESGLGRNFENFEDARPGDFMKIFWSAEIGKLERGHSVVYLGRETVEGVERVRFWSSNQPTGYGVKSVPRTKISYAIFSRLEHPEALAQLGALPARDAWLAGLTSKRSSVLEVRTKTGM